LEDALGRLRFPVDQGLGRRYPELTHLYRNEFQRDRDRVVHSRAFRRLEDKTQVFAPGISDHFRNRLTHTIEVSQISRTVAGVLKLEEDLTEALALVHDIGHPPFGHAGEDELDRQMQRFGDRFDHNLHALRIVEQFEQRYARFPGLNLTFEVREGIVKHSRDIPAGQQGEMAEFLPGLRPPLEAQLIDLADEIAYNTADLDDAYSAGMFTVEDIEKAVPRYSEILGEIEIQFPGASNRVRFHEALRRLIDGLVSGLIEGTFEAARHAGVETVNDVRNYPQRLARFTAESQATSKALKQFLHRRVYSSQALVEEREKSTQKIAELFEFYVSDPSRLPETYREQVREAPSHRVVCDYIAGMTERYFTRLYQQAYG
jgi:dGTPase